MKLNIYVLSHPVIQIFNKNIINNQTIIQEQSKITVFLIYEILRKLIIITNIYIYKITFLQQFSAVDYKQKNYIITNIVENLHMIKEISETFPQTEIKHFNFIDRNQWNTQNLENMNNMTNIIILEKFLIEDNIIQLINFFKDEKKIQEKQITIACITCNNQMLEKISQFYSDINIYTTKIIYM